jgi:pimeloyl-ACP methyl ester carboxylesterase
MRAPESAPAWTESEISTGDLSGSLTLPHGASAVPAVLLLAGSGPVDRDGNLPGMPNNSLKLLAQALAAHGIAALRVDKRGVGASQANATREEDLRFRRYVDDACAWATRLASFPRVSDIFLLGHSEGALVATLAAQRVQDTQHSKTAGLILLAGAGEPATATIARQLAAANLPTTLQQASKCIAASLCAGHAVSEVPPELQALYRCSVQNYLMSWLPLDPAAELGKTACPALVVQGTHDIQTGIADAQKLSAARPGVALVLVEGMNHVLKQAPMERAANLQTYRMPQRPLAHALIPEIVAFIHSVVHQHTGHSSP